MSEAEIFLNSIRCLDLEIDALDKARVKFSDRRQDLLDRAEAITSNLSGVCVQSGVSNKTQSIGIALAELPTAEEYCKRLNAYQKRINDRIDELIERKQKALDIIAKIEEPRLGALLIHRYVNGLKWSTIADLMKYEQNFLQNHVRQQAIKAYEEAECGKQPNLS